MRLSLLTGTEAVQAAATPAFRDGWLALYARCPWATACQHPDFVLPWYLLYHDNFLPVILFALSGSGELLGLLTLARRHGSAVFTGAGERQAEYQCWLADQGDGDSFIRTALASLHTEFPGVDVRLRYLPPGIPLGWAADPRHCARHNVLRPHRRPLMHIDAAGAARLRNKKNHRQNYNRLSRIGEVAFERVRCATRFSDVFEEIRQQYDFRQAALHRQTPFLCDPAKEDFLRELQARGLLHTTILSVGGTLAASHVGLASSGRVLHLGLNTHAPWLAAHSPGSLLLAMLGVHLAQEGMPLLDLTPGGDAYKEHFATGHDLVFDLAVYGNAGRKLAGEARMHAAGWLKSGLRASGLRGADLLGALDALKPGHAGAMRKAARHLRARPGPAGLRCRIDAVLRHPGDLAVAKNRLADLLRRDAAATPCAYWGFLRQAMQRMERSHDCYTLVQDGRLALGCMVAAGADGDMLLSDLYVDRRAGRDSVRAFLEQLLYELQRQGRDGVLHCACALDRELRRCFLDSGFTDGTQRDPGLPNPFQAPRLREPRP